MSILDFIKNNLSKSNTDTSAPFSLSGNKIYVNNESFVHCYCVSPEDPAIFVEYENGEVVSKLHFSISKNELKICDFLASGSDKNYHHGTEMIIALLKSLNSPIPKIHGLLSPIDADNRNWTKSIPFYADLPSHIFSKLGLKYQFNLFDDEHYKNDVTEILSSRDERDANIEKYRLEHLYDEEGNTKKRFGSFHYTLL